MLIGFRVIQGIGGAVMSALTLSLITEAYPPEARTGPIGLWAAVSGLAVAGGSVVGGLLLSMFPWSSIFWVNVPIAVMTLVISWFAVAESREPAPRPFDTAGVALSASGLLLLTFGFVHSSDATWRSPVVAICVTTGVAVLVVFFVWEHRAAFPMVPPALLRTPSFGRACAVYLLAYLAFSGFIYYVTLFFQNIDGWSALRTGLSWLFFCIPYFAVAQLSKWVEQRLSVAAAVGCGCLIAAAGVIGMSRLTAVTPFAWAAACYILVGVGFALMVPAGSSAAMAEVPAGSSGIGSGLFNACRQIGTATGLAILGSIGAGVTLADWRRQAGSLPLAAQHRAAQVGADVAGGQVHVAAAAVGQHALDPAVVSFLRGFGLALLLAGAILAAAGVVGFLGLRHLQNPQPSHRHLPKVSARRLSAGSAPSDLGRGETRGRPTDWTSSRRSLETTTGVSTAMPLPAGWHGPGLTGPAAEPHYAHAGHARELERARARGQLLASGGAGLCLARRSRWCQRDDGHQARACRSGDLITRVGVTGPSLGIGGLSRGNSG
jgi:MFS transporter, DHA2 family, methylenomycin A resistance protein